jgi:DNA replication protein DnaC
MSEDSKIDATLKKIAAGMPSGKSNPKDAEIAKGTRKGAKNARGSRKTAKKAPAPNQASEYRAHDLPGDPDCPICQGVGYYRLDVPLEHPDFGKLQICTCRQGQVSQHIHRRLFALSNLESLSHLTFENFKPRGRVGLRPAQAESLELAYNQAFQFAQSLKGWLMLQGGYGCGKTHLAAAIANFAVSMGVPTLFLTVPDLLDSLRFAYDDPESTFEQRFDEIRDAPLLVMDDFGTQNATGWAREKLFQILNYRYINHLPLVVTTNLLLGEIEERIRSRMEDPDLVTRVHMRTPDYRQPTNEIGREEFSSLGLLHNLTFATFDLRKGEGLTADHIESLKRGLEAAREFAERPRGWLVITGPFGCGKTHLAAAIANYRSDLGHLPMFVSVPDLLDHLRATFGPYSNVTLDRRFEEIRTAPLLILDDLGTQSMTSWGREKLYQLFNYRYLAELPTVITTPEFKDEMDARLLSRMQDTRLSRIIALTAPSYRGVTRQAAPKRGRGR